MSEHSPSPDDQVALCFNRANAAYRAQDWSSSLDLYSQTIRLNSTFAQAHLGIARCLVNLGEQMRARDAFADTLRLEPDNYSAWLEAGHLCRQMGAVEQALVAYQKALNCSPQRYEAHLALARVLWEMGMSDQATHEQEQAMTSARSLAKSSGKLETPAEVAQHMGRYLLDMGNALEAEKMLRISLEEARAINDQNCIARAQVFLGDALWRQGNKGEATHLFSHASTVDNQEILTHLAELSYRCNLWQESIEVLRKVVALHPNNKVALWNLAQGLVRAWQVLEAEQLLAQIETEFGAMPGQQMLKAEIAMHKGDVDGAIEVYSRIAKEVNSISAASSAAMLSLYSDRLDAQAVANLHRQSFASMGQGARALSSFNRSPLAGRRIRLGLVSADMHHQHPVNIFFQPILREINRAQFEVFFYFTGSSYDDQTELASGRVDHWSEVGKLNDAQLAKQIDADQIDLLVDLSGHTKGNRSSLFAQRAAPVQATYLGYPGSTGIPNIDWLIGDEEVTPSGCDYLYSEKIARLPHTVFCYAPEAQYPYPDFSDSLAQRPITFGSFNNLPKLTPRTLQVWARILKALPDARFILKAPGFIDQSVADLFGERLDRLGVDLSKVEFRSPTGLADMMAQYADIDIALDTLPYNGGTTTMQAMWMGAPVVTERGHHFVSRMGASFMSAANLSDWVACNDDEYVRIAIEKSQDRVALLELKQTLRQRLQANLAWDATVHTRSIERAFELMARSLKAD